MSNTGQFKQEMSQGFCELGCGATLVKGPAQDPPAEWCSGEEGLWQPQQGQPPSQAEPPGKENERPEEPLRQ